jgi:DNA-binding transcriptional regulator YiaG
MPKVKFMQSKSEKRRTAATEKALKIKGEIGRLLGKYDLSKEEFAEAIGMSASTLYRRWRKPEELTVGELTLIRLRFKEFDFAL